MEKREMFFVAVIVGLLLISNTALGAIIDDNPAPWRGGAQTTYQSWGFGNDTNPTVPDVDGNPYGPASLTVTGTYPKTRWKSEDNGQSGVWAFEDWVRVEIQNEPVVNPYKEIWIQITYWADAVPEFVTLPSYTGVATLEDSYAVGTLGYVHETYSMIIEPNPDQETLYILPRNCTIFLDDLVIETVCVPEPLTVVLLGMGGLMLGSRRNRMGSLSK